MPVTVTTRKGKMFAKPTLAELAEQFPNVDPQAMFVWSENVAERFIFDELTVPCIAGKPWHYIHIPQNNKGETTDLISYYSKPLAIKPSSVRIGKYLKNNYPELTDQEITKIVEKYKSQFFVMKFASTPEEIKWTYICFHGYDSTFGRPPNSNIDRSCMRFDCFELPEGIHPTYMYSRNPHCKIAYITQERYGVVKTVARTVVNTKDKLYGRVYASDSVTYCALESFLQRDGYRLHPYPLENLEFCDVPGKYTHPYAPYLDDRNGCHMIIGEYSNGLWKLIPTSDCEKATHYADHTDGIARTIKVNCAYCRQEVPKSQSRNLDGDRFCLDCYAKHVHPCSACGELTLRNNKTFSLEHGYVIRCSRCMARGGYVLGYSDIGDVFFSKDCIGVCIFEAYDGSFVTLEHLSNYVLTEEGYAPKNQCKKLWGSDLYIRARTSYVHSDGVVYGYKRISDLPEGTVFTGNDRAMHPMFLAPQKDKPVPIVSADYFPRETVCPKFGVVCNSSCPCHPECEWKI